MERLERWSLAKTPALLRPGSMARTPGGKSAKVWVNAIWFHTAARKPAVTFGSVWAIVPVTGDEPVTMDEFLCAYVPHRFNPDHDGAVTFDGQTLTARGHKKNDAQAARKVSPHRARTMAGRLIPLHAEVLSARAMPPVLDGYEGWFSLTPDK